MNLCPRRADSLMRATPHNNQRKHSAGQTLWRKIKQRERNGKVLGWYQRGPPEKVTL